MKRFLYQASVKSAEGTQVFYIDAETRAEADDRAANDDTDGIHQHEVEVMDLYPLDFVQETAIDDYGDFPPADNQAQQDADKVGALSDPLNLNQCQHPDCGRFNGPRSVECRAMADNACARSLSVQPASGKDARDDVLDALNQCRDQLLHDGVPVDMGHPRRLAVVAADVAIAAIQQEKPWATSAN